MSNPELYKIGINYSCFSFKLFTWYLVYGFLQSNVIFILAFLMVNANDMQPGGKNLGFWVTGHVVYGTCILVANLFILFRFHNYTGWSEWCSIGMSLNFFTMLYIESFFDKFEQTYHIYNPLVSQPIIWFQIIAILCLLSIFELGYKFHRNLYEDEEGPKHQTTISLPV